MGESKVVAGGHFGIFSQPAGHCGGGNAEAAAVGAMTGGPAGGGKEAGEGRGGGGGEEGDADTRTGDRESAWSDGRLRTAAPPPPPAAPLPRLNRPLPNSRPLPAPSAFTYHR